MKIFSFVLLVASIVFSSPKPTQLNLGVAQEFDTFNSMIAKTGVAVYLAQLTNRTLNGRDPSGKWIPILADRIPSFKNGEAQFITLRGQKAIQATWKIRQNAKWGDGHPVTCKDLKVSHEIGMAPTVSVAVREAYSTIEKIEWKPQAPNECVITYTDARPDFYAMDGFYIVPAHLEGPLFAQHGKTPEAYERNSLYTKAPTTPGLYLGPYLIQEVKLGSHLIYQVNPHFYGPKPQIAQIVIKLITDTGTMLANLQSGTIDVIGTLGLTMDQVLEFERKIKTEKLPFTVSVKPGHSFERLLFNLEDPMLKDLRVRQALIYGLNRELLVQSFFEDKMPAAHHFIPLASPWYTEDPRSVKKYTYDIRKAEKLLDEAGWKKDAAGVRHKEGQKLELVLATTAGNKARETVQVFIKEQWRSLGVEVVIKNAPARVLFGESLAHRTFKGLILMAAGGLGSAKAFLHSTQIPSEKNNFSGMNFNGWSRPDVDRLIDAMDLEFDVNKQKKIAGQLVKIYMNEVPEIPLYYHTLSAVYRNKLKGFELYGDVMETQSAENWKLVQ